MINEKYTLAKLPLRGSTYYYVTWTKREIRVISRVFTADAFDYRVIASGAAFVDCKTAEREKYNVYKALTGKEWDR